MIPDWHRGGRLRASSQRNFGATNVEHYAVDCPFCGDERGRLSLQYQYGTPHPNSGKPRIHLLKCFHNECFDIDTPGSWSRQHELWKQLQPGRSCFRVLPALGRAPVNGTPRKILEAQRVDLPANITPIIDVETDYAAVEYLEARHFDPQELWERWRVYYCDFCGDVKPKFRHRLVIPVYGWIPSTQAHQRVHLVGWQARAIAESSAGRNDPKYLTAAGFSASAAVYGLTWASELTGPVVICEGVTDVWRLGTNAVAIFGKKGKLSLQQQSLILQRAQGRPIVFFADADAVEETSKSASSLLRAARSQNKIIPRCVVAQPPSGRSDAGACMRVEAWDAVARALGSRPHKLGVDFSCQSLPRHPRQRYG
ncbi:hypothetical protein ETAA8_35560 [Anatilimnocola aggregata]|uniref:Toprim domain-containing protein n=1 Tax=Anatilimnocola aggregata TaxID=2528021 RepID=A0A517YE06_9BACT|nr:hypothetical protein ETAA8_35560 [Anatilimnocola aggregata]